VIDRRTFLAGTGAVLFASPFAAEAQRAGKVARVVVLNLGPAPPVAELAKSPFTQSLRELGWVEGQNLLLERKFAESSEQLQPLADEIAASKPDVIVVPSVGIAAFARKATSTVPIVVIAAGLLEGTGFVASLARPGGNVTGSQAFSTDLVAKRLELLKEVSPKLARVGVVWETATLMPETAHILTRYRDATDVAGQTLGIERIHVTVSRPEEFERAFDAFVAARAQAVLVYGTPFLFAHRKQLADLALRSRLPSAFEGRAHAEAGGLLAYGANSLQMQIRAASFVDRILRGAKPGDLPIEQPTTFTLVINLKTAKALGLTIPPSLLRRADEVIQ
jgi:putative ABC transport system substrate-binding protein